MSNITQVQDPSYSQEEQKAFRHFGLPVNVRASDREIKKLMDAYKKELRQSHLFDTLSTVDTLGQLKKLLAYQEEAEKMGDFNLSTKIAQYLLKAKHGIQY